MEIKNPIKILILRTVNLYRGSAIKPFGGLLKTLYLKYFQEKMKENKRVVSEIDGIKYELNLNQFSELETYYGGGYEPEVVKIIETYVKPGMTVIDIGARIGLHAMRLKKLVGKEGKVIAVEPDKKTFSRLLKNADLNNFSIIAENIAFSDKDEGNEITLDTYVKNNKIEKIDFIKLDTDGFEYQIIKGGLETLKKLNPVMVVEFNKESLDNGSLEKIISLLESLEYKFYPCKILKQYKDKETIFKEVSNKGIINVLCR